MGGLTKDTPIPEEIKLHQKSNALEIRFSDGKVFTYTCEFLRVYSPSAEVRGHGIGQEILQVGKKDIGIVAVEPVGAYAVKLRFTDGHETGIYSWDYFYEMGMHYDALWEHYLRRLSDANASRDSNNPSLKNEH